MDSYQLFVLGSLAIVTLIVVLLVIRLKKVLLPMQGMIISVCLGECGVNCCVLVRQFTVLQYLDKMYLIETALVR